MKSQDKLCRIEAQQQIENLCKENVASKISEFKHAKTVEEMGEEIKSLKEQISKNSSAVNTLFRTRPTMSKITKKIKITLMVQSLYPFKSMESNN